MDANKIEEFMKKTADYVESSQAELAQKTAELEQNENVKANWARQATKTAAVLCDRGIIDRQKADEFTDKIAEDPSYALTFMEKMAKLVGSDQLGQASTIQKMSDDQTDPFTREYFPELNTNSGLID